MKSLVFSGEQQSYLLVSVRFFFLSIYVIPIFGSSFYSFWSLFSCNRSPKFLFSRQLVATTPERGLEVLVYIKTIFVYLDHMINRHISPKSPNPKETVWKLAQENFRKSHICDNIVVHIVMRRMGATPP